MRRLASAGLLAVACAAAPPPARAPDARSLDAALADYAAQSAQPTSRQTSASQQSLPARQLPLLIAPRTIREPERQASRPFPRGHRIDVHFADAELGQAIALLADAGHFGLVTRELPSARVTLALRDVDPYDALLAICEARGVAVHTRGRIVIVTAAK